MNFKLLLLIILVFSHNSEAFELRFKTGKIKLTIPYTFGSHLIEASQLQSRLVWNQKEQEITEGEISLLVSDLISSDDKLKCHMMETLTLDYSHSDFPEAHVCENNRLPTEGKNSPAFPLIKMKILRPLKVEDKELFVEWDIHGKKQQQTIPINLIKDSSGSEMSITSKWTMKRSDFDLKVKKFLFIDADNKVFIDINLVWSFEK